MSARADSRLPQVSPAATLALADKLDCIFDILAERALQETGATSVAIGLLRDGGVTCRATAGLPMIEVGDPINRQTGLTALAIHRQMSQWCSDTEFAIFSGTPDAFSLADLNAVKKLSHWISAAVEPTTVKTSLATITPAKLDDELSDEQPPIIFNSGYMQEGSLRNYAASIWRTVARLLPKGQRGRAS